MYSSTPEESGTQFWILKIEREKRERHNSGTSVEQAAGLKQVSRALRAAWNRCVPQPPSLLSTL